MPNRTGDIFLGFALTLRKRKFINVTDLSARTARQTFPWQKNLRLMQKAHLRNLD